MNQYVQEIKKFLKKQGFSDLQIAEKFLDFETRLQARLVNFSLNRLTPEEKKEYGQLVLAGESPEKLAKFLNLKKEELEKEMEKTIKEFKDELSRQYSQKK